jgi:hypothetical protein
MNTSTNVQQVTQVKMSSHAGRSFLRDASTYPTVLKMLGELVQNSIDSNASRIEVEFDRGENYCRVSDDGEGVSRKLFLEGLKSVGEGMKEVGKLGQFGLGKISVLDKCEISTFTSCPEPHSRGYNKWTLARKDIETQRENVTIPMEELKSLCHESRRTRAKGNTLKKVWWRSETEIFGLTKAAMISKISLDLLENEIQSNYSAAMGKKVVVHISFTDEKGELEERVVRSKSFEGKRLSTVIMTGEGGENAVFRIHLPTTQQREKVTRVNVRFGELDNPFRFTFAEFGRSSARHLLSDELLDALRKGYFQGEILSSHAKLTESRNCFRAGDDLVNFCILLEKWFKEHGRAHLEAQREEQSDERYQNLGRKSLAMLQKLFKNPEHADLSAVFKSFTKGSTGKGHKPRRGSLQDEPSISVEGGGKRVETSEEPRERTETPERDRPEHIPLTVIGPKGKKRKIVRGNSLGLQLAHGELGGDAASQLWELDCELGILTFNYTHPSWKELDRSDSALCALQELIVIKALTTECMPEEWREELRVCAEEEIKNLVPWLKMNRIMKLPNRKPRKKKASKDKKKAN